MDGSHVKYLRTDLLKTYNMSDGDFQTEQWMPAKPDIKELVKGNYVHFESFREGNFYYHLRTGMDIHTVVYQFVVPMSEVGGGTLLAEDKAIMFMRWIRKSIENGTFHEV